MSMTTGFELEQIVHALHEARRDWRALQKRTDELGGRELPSVEALRTIIHGLRGALFPMRLGPAELRQENEDFYVGHTLGSVLHTLFAQIRLELRYQERYLAHHTIDESAIEQKAHEPAARNREWPRSAQNRALYGPGGQRRNHRQNLWPGTLQRPRATKKRTSPGARRRDG